MMRSPFYADVAPLLESVDRAIGEAFSPGPFQTLWSRSNNGAALAQPMPLDAYATADQAVVTAAVPGMRPEDLEVTVHENTINLAGTIGSVTDTEEAKGATWFVHELGSGSYRRSITLPFPIDATRVEANFANGIVRITAPKAEHAKPRKITINSTATEQPEAIAAGDGKSQAKPAK
jgi:HSP20 family protein